MEEACRTHQGTSATRIPSSPNTANALGLKATAESKISTTYRRAVMQTNAGEWPVRQKSAARRELKTEASWAEFLE